ncbi:HD-GYP domain-containing protein [Pseudomarimonas arenosa]|uniref:HD domain-containing protein n=1 Tax=Pseudomarimonas arenosa TaxID=2774145 RepID=A0AAW3ZEL6_9GAMM|nr:HD domain-containing phosphohydrolase [Pseudomarimonas arenosa]MBD8524670.1 HD domain-containing protein [Pseudomarimonas arenosa]
MAARALTPQDLHIGEPLPWPVHDRQGNLLLRKGDVIRTEDLYNAMLARGFVIEAERQREAAPLAPKIEYHRMPVFRRMRAAQDWHEAAMVKLHSAYPDALSDCLRLAALIMVACDEDADAALAAFQVDAAEQMRGGSARYMHAAVLADLMSRAIGLQADRRQVVIGAAMTYDLGMFRLADALNSQRDALSLQQRQLLEGHPDLGAQMLSAAGVDAEAWLTAVRDHHERVDGSGYPRGLSGSQIGLEARLIAMVDIYSAMIRPRAYRDPLQAKDALRQIFLDRGKQIDEELAQTFIREIGVFPPGSLVRLKNGEIAVVVRRGENAAQPMMWALLGSNGHTLTGEAERRATDPEHAVVSLVSLNKYRGLLPKLADVWTRTAERQGSEAVGT